MALLASQQLGYAGTLPTLNPANSSDTVTPDDRVFLWYKNTNAATRTIEVVTPTTLDQFGQSLPNISITIGATTGEEMIGPMVPALADPSTGLITVNVTPAVTNVTVAAVRV